MLRGLNLPYGAGPTVRTVNYGMEPCTYGAGSSRQMTIDPVGIPSTVVIAVECRVLTVVSTTGTEAVTVKTTTDGTAWLLTKGLSISLHSVAPPHVYRC